MGGDASEGALRSCAVAATGTEPSTGDTAPTGPDAPIALEVVVATVLAVAAGVVLRFTTRSGLWLDEALSVNIAQLPLGDITGALRHDGHPPLYYVLLHLWISVFGDSDIAVRALAGVASIVAMVLAFVAGRRIGGRRLGWLSLGVFALTPFLIRYGTEARMYSLVTVLVLAGYLVVDDIVRRDRAQWWRVGLLAVVVAAGLWTHYWVMWPTAALGIVLVWTWRRDPRPAVRSGAVRTLLGLIAGVVLFVPWVPTLLFQSAHTGTPWAGPVRPVAYLALTFTDLGGGAFADAAFVGSVLVVLVLLGLFGRGLDRWRIELDVRPVPRLRAEATVLALTAVIGLVVTYVTWSAYATRYASVFVPLLLLFAAAGISRFVGRLALALVYITTLGLLAMGGVFNITYQRTQTTALAPLVAERASSGDVVVTCPDQLGPATMRAFPNDLVFVGYPTLDPPALIDWTDYGSRPDPDPDAYAAQVLDLAGADHAVFVVWSTTYLTHEGTCDALVEALARVRPPETLMNQEGSRYYESATLTVFPAEA